MTDTMLPVASPVKRQVLARASGELPSVSMSASIPGEDSTLADRLRFAIAAEDRTPTSTETAMFPMFGKGDISRLCNGKRGTKTIEPHRMGALADFLHVRFEWLLLGKGSMRRDGRTEKTPAEQARGIALTFNIREDAWLAVWERNKDRATEMAAADWFDLIRTEADRLTRSGVPRPEEIKLGQMEWTDKKERRSKAKRAPAVESKPVPQARRRVAGDT